MELIYILTYDCNFRCTYCDIDKRKEDMTNSVINQSRIFLEKNNFLIEKVKFFGGEPLIKKNFIIDIVSHFPPQYTPKFFVTTNSTLINEDFIQFAHNNNLYITFSIDGDASVTGENRLLINGKTLSHLVVENTKKYAQYIRVNQVITSKNSCNFFKNFLYLYNLGVRNFNFLPEYYALWSKTGLKNLKAGFDSIFEFCKEKKDIHIVNLENYSEVAFFNIGIVIDTDGSVYGTNLILSGKFEKYKPILKVGDVFSSELSFLKNEKYQKQYLSSVGEILQKEYSQDILICVKYVDLILNNFCNNVKTYGA